ncbi:MFS transporter [Paraburkholderia susongensis]|uniref:Predicted arabinose efflux permease, MFS family n=1 Tax=Paraburkholderia susongensis TaxID=1515439 RepID=A0A1X7M2N0_9BURK|nr:MFS transporter [Paraburkholderia susongensis]SMG59957.1 Predicted arabinose efflux permease, MFS family [Paraburkholderia susongensis]
MKLRNTIILMTTFAVISDAILIPFYPQFFSARYGVTSPVHAGAYVAFISIVVMLTLPVWARVAKRLDAMHLLVYTQCAAGVLSLASYWAPTVPLFWVLSLAMFMCKSSYLLMYPYMMRLEPKESHAHTIGLLSVVVHFGAIAGAVAGGFVMQVWNAHACIFAMAAGDFAQMVICIALIRSHAIPRRCRFANEANAEAGIPVRTLRHRLPILRLALLMLVFDFCVYLIRPFMSSYWQSVSDSPNELLSGAVFAIPGMVALAALRINKRIAGQNRRLPDHMIGNLLLCTAGVLLQSIEAPLWIIVGRVLFGWAFFQIVVKLDVTMFALSTPASYAADFSVINFFQNLGVLLASFAAGAIVDETGLRAPFFFAAAGLVLSALLSIWLLDRPRASAASGTAASPSATLSTDLADSGATAHAN